MGLLIVLHDKKGKAMDDFGRSYSTFYAFRIWLCQISKITKITKKSPFYELLSKSDVEGGLNYEECKLLKRDFVKMAKNSNFIRYKENIKEVEDFNLWKKFIDSAVKIKGKITWG